MAGVYTALSRDLKDEPISENINVTQLMVGPDGRVIRQERTVRAQISGLEHLVNERALEKLRNYSYASLGVLFVASLGVGWLVAGRVVRPSAASPTWPTTSRRRTCPAASPSTGPTTS
ncbi:MAG: hypothetical protein H6518_04520 [Microthrixaceae bacterium]|nr:hypothetical protein [Microthrixaceae bacterium]